MRLKAQPMEEAMGRGFRRDPFLKRIELPPLAEIGSGFFWNPKLQPIDNKAHFQVFYLNPCR
jgi:hypothetical protein